MAVDRVCPLDPFDSMALSVSRYGADGKDHYQWPPDESTGTPTGTPRSRSKKKLHRRFPSKGH